MASPTFTQKFAITSAMLANCLSLSAVLTVQGLSSCFFTMPSAFRRSHIRVTLFCNLIGAA